MSYYLTLREGPSAATSVPLLVVSDERVVGAFLRELSRITCAPARTTLPLPLPAVPVETSAPPPRSPDEQQSEGLVRS